MERSDIKRIGQILKDRRLQLGYTQEFAAEKVGISYSYYTKIERGEQLPSLEVCLHIAKTFRLSLDSWLLNTLPDLKTAPEMAALFRVSIGRFSVIRPYPFNVLWRIIKSNKL